MIYQNDIIQNLKFPLRIDQNGYRPVFKLGNERGPCPFQCTFCGVGKSSKVSSEENIRIFDEMYAEYLKEIDGPYHPGIYNRGNVTDPEEFSSTTLNHILDRFDKDKRIQYVSLNSREKMATLNILNYLMDKNLSFPIHFILGVESFSEIASKILGKDTSGELEKFINKLKRYNKENNQFISRKKHLFGLDVNLLFLPELYLKKGETRHGNYHKIRSGILYDLKQLIARIDPDVPIEINIHPFYSVDSLPYETADLYTLLKTLPSLQKIIEEYNDVPGNYQTHIFLGIVFLKMESNTNINYSSNINIQNLKKTINDFNQYGKV